MRLSAAEIAAATGGRVVGDATVVVQTFGHDSRTLQPESCFVALVGERDGHEFVVSAFDAGARVALVSDAAAPALASAGGTLVVVPDPLAALADVAREARRRLRGTVVAITGSTGKTSTKDLLAGALGGVRSVHAAAESHNNEVGLPLTVLNAPEGAEVTVTEMGARFAGNIAELCEIALPEIGVVTNVGLAHAEHLGGPEGVLRVKGELFEALPASGIAVVNADDPSADTLAARTAARVVRAGRAASADVRIARVEVRTDLRATVRLETPAGTIETTLGLRGAHQAENAALAVAVAVALDADLDAVAEGLARATGSRWRMEVASSPGGVLVVNDAYNANPASMDAALLALQQLPVRGRRIAVLGGMRELGAHAVDAHARIGAKAAAHGVDLLVAVGDAGGWIADAAAVAGVRVADAREALETLAGTLDAGDAVLVKASRAVGLEAVADELVAGAGDRQASRGEAGVATS